MMNEWINERDERFKVNLNNWKDWDKVEWRFYENSDTISNSLNEINI